MNVELHADQDIIDALQAMKEKAEQYAALLSVLRQCVEAMEPFAEIDECGIGFIVGDESEPEHMERCAECKAVMAARAALAAARPYLERKEGEG